jgi:hypothetical protein
MPTETIVIEFQSNIEGLVKAEAAIDGVDAAGKNLATDFKKGSEAMNASMTNTAGNAEKLSTSLKDVSKNAQFNGAKDQLNKFGTEVNETVGKSQRLTTQLRAMKQQLSDLDSSGQAGSKAFQKLAKDAAKLEDQIGDTSKRIRALASDTKNIDAVVGVVSGLAGAFSAAQGAAALLGGENEDLQKSLLKVQAAMALATGVQQVANTLQKESVVVLGLQRAALAVSSTAQAAYAVVVGTSTGALKAFRIALASTGIGLLVIGVIALVNAFKDWVDAADEATAAQEALNKATEQGAKDTAYYGGLQRQQIEKELELLKIKGASNKEIHDKEIELLDTQIAAYKKVIDTGKGLNDEDYLAYKKLLNDKEILNAKFEKDESDRRQREIIAARKQQEDLKTIGKGANANADGVTAIPGDVSNIPEVVTATEVENYKTFLAQQGADARFAIRQQEAKDQEETDRQLQAALLNTSIQLGNQLFSFGAAINAKRQADLDKRLKQGTISEKQYAKQVAEIKRKQAIAEKEAAAFNIIINTAIALSKVAAQTGILAPILGAAIATLGAVELATVLAQPIPAFAKGTEKVEGGTPGKDSVLAWLMPGERIVPTEINKQLGGIKNEDLPKLDFTPSLPNFDGIINTQNRWMQYGNRIDYDMLGKSVAKHMGKELQDMPRDVVNFDEKGVSKFIERGLSRTEIKSKRGNF